MALRLASNAVGIAQCDVVAVAWVAVAWVAVAAGRAAAAETVSLILNELKSCSTAGTAR